MNTFSGRMRSWKPVATSVYPAGSDPVKVISSSLGQVLDVVDSDGSPLALAVLDAKDGTVRAYTHFWPHEASTLGNVTVEKVYEGDAEGDVALAFMTLDHDETLTAAIDTFRTSIRVTQLHPPKRSRLWHFAVGLRVGNRPFLATPTSTGSP